MGANSSPPAADAVMSAAAAAAIKAKKRKTSDAPLPVNLAASMSVDEVPAVITPTTPDADSLHTEATLERMATALDLSHSLVDRALLDPTLPKSTSLAMEDSRARLEQLSTFVDALRSADVEGVALQLQRMFVGDAGILSTLRDATDRVLSHAMDQHASITRTRRVSSAASLASTQAAAIATAAETSSGETGTNSTTASSQSDAAPSATDGSNDVLMDSEDEDLDPRASLHEEEAAQALTGLRLSSASNSASAAAAAVAAVAAEAASASKSPPPAPQPPSIPPLPSASTLPALAMPIPSPRPPHPPGMLPVSTPTAARDISAIPSSIPYNSTHVSMPPLPSMSPTHALSIFAPQPMDLTHAGLFVAAPPTSAASPMGTPGALPSLFSRGFLAPIATPYDPSKTEFAAFVSSPMVGTTPMMTPHGQHLAPFVDWKTLPTPSSAISNQNTTPSASVSAANAAAAASAAAAAAAASTDTTSSSTDSNLTPVTNLYRSSPQTSGQASPVKRKSITAKQLVASAINHGANLSLPIAKSLAALERTHPARKANPRRWTKEEDDALRKAVENHKEKNWKAIASQVPGRNHTQCLQRWTKVLAPGLVKGHWSPHEDELLKRLVAGGNKNWGEVAAKIPGRTSKQCRERWHNHLDPNIVRGAYTPEEDRIILEAQARLGNRWSVIAAMLPGRTEDAVKIRWKSHCRLWKARKYLRKGGADASGDGGAGVGDGADADSVGRPSMTADDLDDVDSSDENDVDDEEQQQEESAMPVAASA